MKKVINYDSSATEGLRAGVNKLAKAVTVTLGVPVLLSTEAEADSIVAEVPLSPF